MPSFPGVPAQKTLPLTTRKSRLYYTLCVATESARDKASRSSGSAALDFGYFTTACTVVTGFALPLVLSNASIIHPAACWMSTTGGVIVYGTSLFLSFSLSSLLLWLDMS